MVWADAEGAEIVHHINASNILNSWALLLFQTAGLEECQPWSCLRAHLSHTLTSNLSYWAGWNLGGLMFFGFNPYGCPGNSWNLGWGWINSDFPLPCSSNQLPRYLSLCLSKCPHHLCHTENGGHQREYPTFLPPSLPVPSYLHPSFLLSYLSQWENWSFPLSEVNHLSAMAAIKGKEMVLRNK